MISSMTDRLNRTLFDVEVRPGLEQDTYEVMDTTNNRVISNVSSRYELVRNRDVVMPFVEKFGINSLNSILNYSSGKSYAYTFDTGRVIDINGNGDMVKQKIVVVNSYDKSKSFKIMYGAFRLICSNGMFVGTCDVNYRKIHAGNIPVSSIVNGILNSYDSQNYDIWRDFAKYPMTKEEELKLVENFKAFEEPEEDKHKHTRGTWHENVDSIYYNRKLREQAYRLIEKDESRDHPRTAWGLYNILNRVIMTDWQLAGASKFDKRLTANRRAEEFVKEIVVK